MKVEIIDVKDWPFTALVKQGGLTDQEWNMIGYCYDHSEERWMGAVDKIVACMWGLIPPTMLSDRAYLWLYHNEIVEEHKFTFIRHSQIQMKRMLSIYPHIVGECMITNPTGRKWLQWLGAKFGLPDGFLAPFEIKASNG